MLGVVLYIVSIDTEDDMKEMKIHAYEEGCGFNATIPNTNLWRSRYPMNAHELKCWVNSQKPQRLVFSGDVNSVRIALQE